MRARPDEADAQSPPGPRRSARHPVGGAALGSWWRHASLSLCESCSGIYVGGGEYVLGIGYRAAELLRLSLGDSYDLTWEKIPLSFETGSNASGWGG